MRVPDRGRFALSGVFTSLVGRLFRGREQHRQVPIRDGWPRAVIVGAGFGGLRVARGLAGVAIDVLVVDRHNYHCFQPLLYQVATAGLEPEEIAHPIRATLRDVPNVRFRLASVRGVDLAARQVLTDDGAIAYDYLVLAAGSTTNYFGLNQLATTVFGLKDLNEAVQLRNHLLECFERAVAEPDPAQRASLLTFVVAGGGPTGVEFVGALAELIRLVLAHDYAGLDLNVARVVLVEAGPSILTTLAPSLQEAALRAVRGKGVEVRVNAAVAGFDGQEVSLANGESISSHTLVWAAGVRATALGDALGVAVDRAGRVLVTPTLQLPGHPELYVIGDLAHCEQDGKPLPMVAPVAIQQAALAAANIRRQISGAAPLPFVYQDRGTMATIGRNAAVAQLGRLRLTGFAAWVIWLVVHLLQLVSFRNRVLVLINWIWDYLFFDRAVRLITSD
jgi:NADH dehydrogenase